MDREGRCHVGYVCGGGYGTLRVDEGIEAAFLLQRLEVVVAYIVI
jgi:hypothetical protein